MANRVLQKLEELSDELHEMELNGEQFTDQEDSTWGALSLLIVEARSRGERDD